MGRKLGGLCPFGGRGAGSPSNTLWPGPRPTCVPSFILIHPTVWPQCTNVTDRTGQDRQTDRQRSDSIGEPFYKRSPKNASSYAIGPLSRLSVTLVYCGQTVGRIKMKLGMQVSLDPGHIVLDGNPAPPSPKGVVPPIFS